MVEEGWGRRGEEKNEEEEEEERRGEKGRAEE